eukprot:scaffold22764_cov134-Cylindrotheca_fusiformis.AAC.5
MMKFLAGISIRDVLAGIAHKNHLQKEKMTESDSEIMRGVGKWIHFRLSHCYFFGPISTVDNIESYVFLALLKDTAILHPLNDRAQLTCRNDGHVY